MTTEDITEIPKASQYKIVTIDPAGSQGHGLLEKQVKGHLGIDQLVFENMADLVVGLGQMDQRPDMILINQARVPNHASDEPTITQKVLDVLKAEESPFANVPVIACYVESVSFHDSCAATPIGVDGCISARQMHFPVSPLPGFFKNVMGLEEIDFDQLAASDVHHFSALETVVKEIPEELRGMQIPALQSFIMHFGLRFERPANVEAFVRSQDFNYFMFHRDIEFDADAIDYNRMSAVISSVLKRTARQIRDEKVMTRDNMSMIIQDTISEEIRELNDIEINALQMVFDQTYWAGAQQVVEAKPKEELSQDQLRAIRVMLENHVLYLEHAQEIRLQATFNENGKHMVYETLPADESLQSARECAKVLERFLEYPDFDQFQTIDELSERLQMMVSDEYLGKMLNYSLKHSWEAVLVMPLGEVPALTEDEVDVVRAAIDKDIQDPNLGPKTKLLLYRTSERLQPGMCQLEVGRAIETFAQLEEYGGTQSWPHITACHRTYKAIENVFESREPSHQPAIKVKGLRPS